jgi:putative ABC transport system permease protein
MFNWLTQVFAVSKFSLQTLPQRKGAALSAVFGIAGVVAVLVGVLSIAQGIRLMVQNSGEPENAIVLRSGSDSEMMSGFGGRQTEIIADAPGIARYSGGAMASPELFVIINLPKRSTGTDANVPLRGVSPAAFEVRSNLEISQGRMFEWGLSELVVGVGASQEFSGLELGSSIEVGGEQWPVVGLFEAGGGLAEGEIWADAAVVQPAYRRGNSYQSVYAKLTSVEAFGEFKDSLTTDPRLNVKVAQATEFYSQQSTVLRGIIVGLGTLIAGLMGLGAIFGALNTMYTAVSARTREIATLRALGYRGRVGLPRVRWFPGRDDQLAKLQPDRIRLRRQRRAAQERDPLRGSDRAGRRFLSGDSGGTHAGSDGVAGGVGDLPRCLAPRRRRLLESLPMAAGSPAVREIPEGSAGPVERQRIVAVGRDGRILEQLEDLFNESAVDVQVVEDPQNALSLIATFPLELVLVEYPLPDGSLAEFIAEASKSATGDPKIVVLADESALTDLLEVVGDRCPVIGCGEPESFRARVAAHLRKWPERQRRLMVRMQVRVGEGGVDRLAQTENISESGVLIRTKERIPVGSEVDLELNLPEMASPVQLSGKVVRHAEAAGGGMQGMGIAFTRLANEAAERLNQYLERSLSHAPA